MTEEWRDIEGFESCYQVSNRGRVRSVDRNVIRKNGSKITLKGKLLSLPLVNGYMKITLYKKSKYHTFWVHRLVALAFIKTDLGKPFVNHINGCRYDNRVSNLEWCTPQQNNLHARDVLGHQFSSGVRHSGKNHTQSKKVKQINPHTGEVIKIWDSVTEVIQSKIASNVSMCATNKLKTSGGFKWEYIL